jgi:nucleoside-diphosphate-sugar epimerase
MRVAVTGATGFIAQHLINELLQHGYQVRGTVRNIDRAKAEHRLLEQVDLFQCNLLSSENWQQAFSGCDALFHTASPVDIKGSEAELIGPAVNGTQHVLQAALAAGVSRIILTSSTAAIVNTEATIYDESNWSKPELCSPYAKSKTLAEQTAWQFVQQHPHMQLTVCNPSVVLGPLPSKNLPQSVEVIEALMSRRIPALVRYGFNMVDVRDVAKAHRLALENKTTINQRYLLTAEQLWLKEINQCLRQHFSAKGYKPSLIELPNCLVKAAAFFHPMAKMLAKDLNKKTLQNNSKAKRDLKLDFQNSEKTLIDTAQSLIDNGFI